MTITQYQTNEIAITLPVTEFIDSTFNAIRFPSLEASLVISRGVMPEGTTVESIIDDQIQKLGAQVRDLHFSMRQSVKTGTGQTLPALEMQSRFTRGNDTVHQYQLAFVVHCG
ncbi:hypothetical protein CBA19CS22_29790 [Caballeronia novacaledonica]|uniref:Uncharacterized protein n=1 Tax=Caballeronia novacaledonica TaxID=1544861 RepID=A0ACB5R1D4_9BURK|nr:hypothetical protein CBA19CS22_29790 [Caballeronia novacaledonica]